MSNISVQEAQSWAEDTKLNLGNVLDAELEAMIATQVFARIAQVYTTSSWITPETTPKLVRSILAMLYMAWYYDRTYSEDALKANPYAALLRGNAETLIVGIVEGSIDLVDVVDPSADTVGQPAFYPTDVSSAQEPTADDSSLGPEAFTMGVIW